MPGTTHWQIAQHASGHWMSSRSVLGVVSLFALQMRFMGGRIAAPAIAGQFHHQGQNLAARVQPRIEAALLVAGIITPLALAVPGWHALAGASAAVSGVLALIRLGRWRLWALRGRADPCCLSVGCAWLAVVQLALGESVAGGRLGLAAVHVTTVGASGMPSFNVMATF
ncbi:MAG: NnrS family protein [Burkholderiaceae bacterium]|nr:NnrS family protein [Burkholderiaceae bacterium]